MENTAFQFDLCCVLGICCSHYITTVYVLQHIRIEILPDVRTKTLAESDYSRRMLFIVSLKQRAHFEPKYHLL
jgi:hypothetical protein